ncbi:MAG: hypothetical protein QF437_01020 [Planctomycetota bacterium]|jgi:hypothetical protein|nr:hypothetical protein [Planctomycetota bacterium]MDP7129040.1 hypothetical protein [Planctomycetota bacterium]MDP7250277.1 hypothetical protein [Planctomycetota bacterium]
MQQTEELEFKPDLQEAKRYWRAFWAHEIIDRPCIHITAPKDGPRPEQSPFYMEGSDGNFDEPVERLVEYHAHTYWGGDAIPNYCPSFGPDQFSAFLGADLEFLSPNRGTSWSVPFVENWEDALPLSIDPENEWWGRMLEFVKRIAEATVGKMIVAHLDLHTNIDALSAIRGPQQLCEDLLDCPDLVDRAMQSVRSLFAPAYDAIYEAGDMARRGSMCWIPTYGEGKVLTLQCDFCCMIGPAMFRRFILPALEEEAAFLDHSIYHYDGPDALVHLDDILGIEAIGAIQWVPGAGNRPFIEWMDLLKKIQEAGKAVWVACSPSEIPVYHRELRPELVFYTSHAKTRKEADDTVEWLRKNT